MIPICDTHQHLWDLDRFRLPWITGGPLARSFVMEDYLEASAGLNVTKTVYMEVDVERSQKEEEAEYVLDLCRRGDNPMAGAVIGGDPASPGFAAYLNRYRGNPALKGVRRVLHTAETSGDYCLREEFVRGVRLLGERGLRFDICIPQDRLPSAAKLAGLCPETRFVLDHCGNAVVPDLASRETWKRGIDEVAARGNVVCKISGIVASAKPGEWGADDLAPIVLHCADAFGRDRIVFGSDWPVCTRAATYREWVEALKSVVSAWSEEDQRKLFYENAVRFYELEEAG